jgi:hypothetical protein
VGVAQGVDFANRGDQADRPPEEVGLNGLPRGAVIDGRLPFPGRRPAGSRYRGSISRPKNRIAPVARWRIR